MVLESELSGVQAVFMWSSNFCWLGHLQADMRLKRLMTLSCLLLLLLLLLPLLLLSAPAVLSWWLGEQPHLQWCVLPLQAYTGLGQVLATLSKIPVVFGISKMSLVC